jgi:hypothetical protein
MFSLIPLCLVPAALAAPSPQGGHDHGAKAPAGGNMAETLGQAFSGLMAPLPLYKITRAEKPEFTVPGVIREQLYYGPLVLQPAAVRSSLPRYKVERHNNEDGQEKAKSKQGIMQMDPSGNVFTHRIANITRDVTLLKSRTSVRDRDGNELGIAQGVYNHHISIPNMNRLAKALLACPKRGAAADMPVNSFAGVGEDGCVSTVWRTSEKEES